MQFPVVAGGMQHQAAPPLGEQAADVADVPRRGGEWDGARMAGETALGGRFRPDLQRLDFLPTCKRMNRVDDGRRRDMTDTKRPATRRTLTGSADRL
jgi:hypothetical protein